MGKHENDMGEAVAQMVGWWEDYAEAYRKRFETVIGTDYVLGDAWVEIGKGLLALLNGDLGKHDGGTLDGEIRGLFLENGFTDEGEDTDE